MMEKKEGDKGVSSFQALMIATASRVGTGNMAGVATAIIMKDAFNFRSIFGGFTGSCMVLGIKRGLFSNEAGMGSAPNASASATVSHPAKQGLAQIISVYIDTLLICSTTVFLILLTGDWAESGYSGIPLLQQCVAKVIGPVGIHFVINM